MAVALVHAIDTTGLSPPPSRFDLAVLEDSASAVGWSGGQGRNGDSALPGCCTRYPPHAPFPLRYASRLETFR